MERASESEQLWIYAITQDKCFKRLTEKPLLKVEDLQYIRYRIFDVINSEQANIYDSKNQKFYRTKMQI